MTEIKDAIENWVKSTGYNFKRLRDNVFSIETTPHIVITVEDRFIRVSSILGKIEGFSRETEAKLYEILLSLGGEFNGMKISMHENTATIDWDIPLKNIDRERLLKSIEDIKIAAGQVALQIKNILNK